MPVAFDFVLIAMVDYMGMINYPLVVFYLNNVNIVI